MKNLLVKVGMLALIVAFSACKKDDDECDTTDPASECYVDPGNPTSYSQKVVGSDTIVTVTDYGEGTGTITWTKNKIWVLNGRVFVNNGQTLTIEAGTVIKGKSGAGNDASALIVAKGGTLNANGTSAEPIIMTAEADNLSGNVPALTRGLWGGLIILGKAQLNSSPGTTAIEGIPTSETRGIYGGSDDADNSGTIQYVSVRHGGTDIGAGNEINGITLGGVGSGTTIDHVEVVSNADDGIEFFGGTARVKNALVAFCGDDGIDYDEGYRGFVQYALVLQESGSGNRCAEMDGGTDPEDGTPYATPEIHNVTYIHNGTGEAEILEFRDNAGGYYYNSIFYGAGAATDGVDIEDIGGQDSRQRLDDGDLVLDNNIWFNIGSNALADVAGQSFVQTHLTAGDNDIADPNFVSISMPITSSTSGLDLQAQSADATGGPFTTPSDAWFTTPTFRGAFGATDWAAGWSFLSTEGFINN